LLCFTAANALPGLIYSLFIRDKCYDYVCEKIVNTGNIDGIIYNINTFSASQPKFIQQMIDIKTLDLTSKDIAENILNNIFEPVILSILKAVVFVLVFIIFFTLTGLIISLVKKSRRRRENERGHKSLARKTDMLLGGAFSLVKALVIVFAVQAILLFAVNVTDGAQSEFVKQVNSSVLLDILKPINPILNITEDML
jgi:NADH:ubiquinone oxidoreductase subunit 3 (subunit A)